MSNSCEFPNVLFITPHAFNRVTGGGITFSNLFAGWPKSAIATIHNDPEPTVIDVCNNYFVLGAEELDYIWPFNVLSENLKKSYERVSNSTGKATDHPSGNPRIISNYLAKGLQRLKPAVVRMLGEGLPERAKLTPRLEGWVKDFQPQVIYTILGSNGIMKLVDDIAKKFNLPIVVHFMDDWLEANHRKGLFAVFLNRQMKVRVREVLQQATCCLAISPSMKEAYQKRFGREFEAFQNTIDYDAYAREPNLDKGTNGVADIVYIGSIFPNAQLQSLVMCCRAVSELNRDGIPAKLTISSPSGHAERYSELLKIDDCVEIVDTIENDEEFFQRISVADLLLLPVNFDEDSVRFIRYSMPTKVPAYVTAGGPVLVYGPRQTAQVAYALNEEWGYVVDAPKLDALADGMKLVLFDKKLRKNLLNNARRVARENHDLKRVRLEFQRKIIEAARKKKQGVDRK
ncbi:MAG: hypothetical protein VX620_16335 [Pseudomonadota bacterium]|nr:hypothetical protein [Pseudomonadota bacterium]